VRAARWAGLLEEGPVAYVTDGGFCSVIRPARDASAPVELAALYVASSHWRRGVGRALVTTALSRDEDVTLWVFAQNDRARGFYAAMRFFDDGAEAVDPGTGVRRSGCVEPPATDAVREARPHTGRSPCLVLRRAGQELQGAPSCPDGSFVRLNRRW
jgi:hypothetical protein